MGKSVSWVVITVCTNTLCIALPSMHRLLCMLLLGAVTSTFTVTVTVNVLVTAPSNSMHNSLFVLCLLQGYPKVGGRFPVNSRVGN